MSPPSALIRIVPVRSLSLSGISGYLISQISQDLSQAAFPTLIYFTNVKHYGFPGASPGLPPSLNKSATFLLYKS